eukprot:281132-Chlamydomonas_euryale.AAC.5
MGGVLIGARGRRGGRLPESGALPKGARVRACARLLAAAASGREVACTCVLHAAVCEDCLWDACCMQLSSGPVNGAHAACGCVGAWAVFGLFAACGCLRRLYVGCMLHAAVCGSCLWGPR